MYIPLFKNVLCLLGFKVRFPSSAVADFARACIYLCLKMSVLIFMFVLSFLKKGKSFNSLNFSTDLLFYTLGFLTSYVVDLRTLTIGLALSGRLKLSLPSL